MTEPDDYRAGLRAELADVDWAAARVTTAAVDPAQVSVDHGEDHAEEDEPLVLVDGQALDELTDDGSVDQGVVGDGAFVPAHWWEV